MRVGKTRILSRSVVLLVLPVLSACSGSGDPYGTGGTTSFGGASGTTGGAGPSMGGFGSPSSGGSTFGGNTGTTTGGSVNGGSSAGGASGGPNGGTSTGGNTSGGSSSGGSANGGSSPGGASNGGSANGGGGNSKGGSSPGGTSSGGASTGGNSSGGSSKGGSSSGGASSGGSSSGGKSGSGGTAGGGGSGGALEDAKTILTRIREKSSNKSNYDKWMNDEIGTPQVATSLTNGKITAPILVPEGATFDGKGMTITPNIPGCSGTQTESQPPVFILTPGASVKNVTISPPACDGIHMMGDNTVDTVVWTDVGEDAASVRSYFPGGKITIRGGSANSADDKVFQFNAPVQVTISNFRATNIAKLVRQNGGETFPMSVSLSNVTVTGCDEAVVYASKNCTLTQSGVTADCPVWKLDD